MTLSEMFKSKYRCRLQYDDKEMIFSFPEYWVIPYVEDDATDKQIDEAFEKVFYCGTNLNEAMNELGKQETA